MGNPESVTLQAKQKPKKCKECKTMFLPRHSTTEIVCSVSCATRYGKTTAEKNRKAAERAERKEHRKQVEALQPRGYWVKKAQDAFNRFIRARDFGLPCISCGKTDADLQHDGRGGMWDCGHYRSIGANPELRFEPLNAARQCKQCNRDLSGNVVNFRINLEQRIGADKLAWVEGPHEPKKYTIEQLKEIRKYFDKRYKHYKTLRGI